LNKAGRGGLDDSNIFGSDGLTAQLQCYSPNDRHPPHAHDRASIGLLLGGSLLERVGRTTHEGALGAVLIKPAGVMHENKYGGAGTIILSLRGTHVERLAERRWEWRRADRALAHAVASIRHARAGRPLACEEALYLLLSEIGVMPPEGSCSGGAPSWLGEAVSLAGRQSGPIRIADIAAQVGVHPVHLTRVFRKHFGQSLRAYIRRIKVTSAAELLRSSDQSVCDVAAELDFFDQSHLCRAFKAECGISPSEYRSLMI
jgi:AraC family transcriptional regulator